jgi:periplasmic divalent cation tolerance protein
MTDLVLILTTMPDDARADELARALVDERLAACVTVGAPMTSTYRWNGAVDTAVERQLTMKTTRARAAALEARVRAAHPYELPEWLVLDASAGAAYAEWIDGATRSG